MANKDKVVIFGTGLIGELAHFYLTHDSPHEVVAFCADSTYISAAEFMGIPLVPFEQLEETYPPDSCHMFVALSASKLNETRASKYEEAKAKGYKLISYVSSRSTMWGDTEIGDNCFILEAQMIQPFVKIGNNVTLWTRNNIGHHATIEDHSFLTSDVVVGGYVSIEPYCFLGLNCSIRDGVRIAHHSVIGSGATIVKDTEENGVYTGIPGRLRSRGGASLKYFS